MRQSLFSTFKLRDITFKNRIFVSPMCQYSAESGMPTSWHMVHYGSRAVGGAGCVIQEATAILPEGRISPADLGIWNDEQADAYRPITRFIKEQGAIPAIQIAHAGRKASISAPWQGNKPVDASNGGWNILAPSAIPFDEGSATPKSMTQDDIAAVIQAFSKAAERSLAAGFEVIEIHNAHGYLLHEFLSPLSNQRTDQYGGSLENRMRLPLEVAAAVRKVWPQHLPVLVRLSATDWVEGAWDIAQAVIFCAKLKEIGIDLIDVSSGGLVPYAKIPVGFGYQVALATAIKQQAQIPVGTVGMITSAEQAEQIIASNLADIAILGRELLRDPHWPLHAAKHLHADVKWPQQYERAKL